MKCVKEPVSQEVISEVVDRINQKIEIVDSLFTEWNSSHERRTAEVDGMIAILEFISGKQFFITKEGLKERSEGEEK